MPDDFAAIASSLGRSSQWNQQNVIGSPIRARTRGFDMNATTFSGYSMGKNRDGYDMNVINELRNPQTIGGGRYGAAVIVERHDVAGVLEWENTVRYTRHFHDRVIDGNPNATSYVYHSWQSIRDKSNPSMWLNYERQSEPVWRCVASRINTSLAQEGRADRVRYMPTGLALARLVEVAVAGGVPGISGGSSTQVINRLFLDDVHLRRVGTYFISLVNYATIYRSSPAGAWAPGEIASNTAATLQSIAWEVASSYINDVPSQSPASCQAVMRDNFCWNYNDYMGSGYQYNNCVAFFTAQNSNNPFYYNAGSDYSYWFR